LGAYRPQPSNNALNNTSTLPTTVVANHNSAFRNASSS